MHTLTKSHSHTYSHTNGEYNTCDTLSLASLCSQPLLAPDWANCMLFIALIVCIVVLFFIKETYKRAAAASAISIHETGKIQA